VLADEGEDVVLVDDVVQTIGLSADHTRPEGFRHVVVEGHLPHLGQVGPDRLGTVGQEAVLEGLELDAEGFGLLLRATEHDDGDHDRGQQIGDTLLGLHTLFLLENGPFGPTGDNVNTKPRTLCKLKGHIYNY